MYCWGRCPGSQCFDRSIALQNCPGNRFTGNSQESFLLLLVASLLLVAMPFVTSSFLLLVVMASNLLAMASTQHSVLVDASGSSCQNQAASITCLWRHDVSPFPNCSQSLVVFFLCPFSSKGPAYPSIKRECQSLLF